MRGHIVRLLFFVCAAALFAAAAPDPADELSALRRIVEREPDDARAHHALGEALASALQRSGLVGKLGLVRQCKAAFERAVELAPQEVAYRRSLLAFYRHAPALLGGGMARAREQAEHIARLDPLLGALSRGEFAVLEERFDDARRELHAVLKSDPDNAPALYQLGLIPLLEKRDPASGIAALKKFVALPAGRADPQYWAAWWHLGMLHEAAGDPDAAFAAYTQAAQIAPAESRVSESFQKLERKSARTR